MIRDISWLMSAYKKINGSGKGGKTGLVERLKKGEGGKGRERREKDGTFRGSSPFVVASSRRLLD